VDHRQSCYGDVSSLRVGRKWDHVGAAVIARSKVNESMVIVIVSVRVELPV
jgi:hypothetical protein